MLQLLFFVFVKFVIILNEMWYIYYDGLYINPGKITTNTCIIFIMCSLKYMYVKKK